MYFPYDHLGLVVSASVHDMGNDESHVLDKRFDLLHWVNVEVSFKVIVPFVQVTVLFEAIDWSRA